MASPAPLQSSFWWGGRVVIRYNASEIITHAKIGVIIFVGALVRRPAHLSTPLSYHGKMLSDRTASLTTHEAESTVPLPTLRALRTLGLAVSETPPLIIH